MPIELQAAYTSTLVAKDPSQQPDLDNYLNNIKTTTLIVSPENIKDIESPKILVLNKIDRDKNKNRLPKILSKLPMDIVSIYDEIIPISSKNSENIIQLKNIIKKYLPEKDGNDFQEIISTKPSEFFEAEYIREACIQFLYVEVPYGLHV